MRDDARVRTTLDIDEDILQAAKELAAGRGSTIGQVLSDLARKGLQTSKTPRVRNGVAVLPRRPAGARGASRPTMALVNSLRDDP